MMENENSQQLCSSLDQARMKTGIEVKFTFETFFREGDLLVTECVADQSCTSDSDVFGGPLTLGKVLCSVHIKDFLSFTVVPLGAKGKDIAASLNPLQDHALTGFFDTGPYILGIVKVLQLELLSRDQMWPSLQENIFQVGVLTHMDQPLLFVQAPLNKYQ